MLSKPLVQLKRITVTDSCVARGARDSPIGLKSMQNHSFLVLLRPIFAQKMKTSPRSCEGVAVIRAEEPFEFAISAEKAVSISVKAFFLEITCF